MQGYYSFTGGKAGSNAEYAGNKNHAAKFIAAGIIGATSTMKYHMSVNNCSIVCSKNYPNDGL